jgi:hypothetical protein
MSEPLVLKVHDEPTYFNKEAAIGLLLFPPLGAVVGAFIGKERMEKEKAQGRIIKEPSDWNKDTLLGGLIGAEIGAVVGYVAAGAILAAGVLTANPGALIAGSELVAMNGAMALSALAAFAGSTLIGVGIGSWIGGDIGKESMQQDKIKAEIENSRGHEHGHGREKQVAHSYEHDMGHGKNHAAAITAERERAALREASLA